MGILGFLFFSGIMTYIGWILGSSGKRKASEMSNTEAFKEGYIKGYLDGYNSPTKKQKLYYEDFPKMGIN